MDFFPGMTDAAGFAFLGEEDDATGLTWVLVLLLSGDDFLLLEDVVRDFCCFVTLPAAAAVTVFFVVATLLFGNVFGTVLDVAAVLDIAFGGVTDLRVFFMVEGMISR